MMGSCVLDCFADLCHEVVDQRRQATDSRQDLPSTLQSRTVVVARQKKFGVAGDQAERRQKLM
jgi:hypothetical protein